MLRKNGFPFGSQESHFPSTHSDKPNFKHDIKIIYKIVFVRAK